MSKKLLIIYTVACLYSLLFTISGATLVEGILNPVTVAASKFEKGNYITWMEFDVPEKVLQQALAYDLASYNQETPFNWIELLAYGAAKNWGKFTPNQKCKEIDDLVKQIENGENFFDLTQKLKLYDFYLECYSAVLSGYVGNYQIETVQGHEPGSDAFAQQYGLKAFSPVAKGYSYTHYDDFGVSRSYGYKRKHQGNDIMGNVGTPIISIEDGYVEALGWNQYGGWRVGIRSHDKRRYYYYAHLRKDHPFPDDLKEGDAVHAGDVIGYLGMTGYSANENVNNISIPHLHFGLQIIFDESQKDGSNQIWIDVYELINFLNQNRMSVKKNDTGSDWIPSDKIHGLPSE